MRRAIYPGSFDPVTNGHLDVIERARKLFDEVIVAVAINDEKQPLFAPDERLAMLRKAITVDAVRVAIETIFLMPKEEYTYLSSRIVKEIAKLGGDVSAFVPPLVADALAKKFKSPVGSVAPVT